MKKATYALLIVGLATPLAMAAPPTSFSDDFQTVRTYNAQTYVDACAGTHADNAGGVGLPDWSIQAAVDGSVAYERVVRGGGKFRFSNWAFDNLFIAGVRLEAAFVGWSGGILACVGEPGSGRSNTVFTHDNLCIYGGYEFNEFQLTSQGLNALPGGSGVAWRKQYGVDLKPGVAGVDDDGNGSTDDDPNCTNGGDGQPGVAGVDDDGNGKTDDPGDHQGTTNCAGDDDDVMSGAASGEYLARGADGCPGICGVDDDGNGLTDLSDVPGFDSVDDDSDGTTDEVGETQFDQAELGFGDDSDDISGEFFTVAFMRTDLPSISLMALGADPRSSTGQFNLADVVTIQFNDLDGADEIGPEFYQANTQYNYAYCATGTVYGARLWIGNDSANAVEHLGPIANGDHSNKANDKELGLSTWQIQNGIYTPVQNLTHTVNTTFGNRFQVLEGNLLPIVGQDRDVDGDVDGVDFSVFASCFNKAGNPPRTVGCSPADASAFDQDGDNDVDGVDFSVFASCFNKAGNPPRSTGCIPSISDPGGVDPPPDNDECSGATVVTEGQITDKITTVTSISWGGDSATTGNCAGNDGGGPDPGRDLWYEYSPSCAGTAVTVTASTANSGVAVFPTGQIMDDTVIAIFNACPPSLGTLIACSNVGGFGDSGKHGPLSTVIDQTALSTVIIAVVGDDDSSGDRGQFALDISCSP
jgi:hypothetical protein